MFHFLFQSLFITCSRLFRIYFYHYFKLSWGLEDAEKWGYSTLRVMSLPVLHFRQENGHQCKNQSNSGDRLNLFSVSLVRGNALRQGSAWRGCRGPMALLLVALTVCTLAMWLYITSLDSDITETLVSQGEVVSPQPRVYTVQCSSDYENYKRYPGEALLLVPYCVRKIRWQASWAGIRK